MTMPTSEQLESRKKVAEFVARVSAPARAALNRIKSEWFGRPDEELKGWIERGAAIAEIADTRGYLLIVKTLDDEVRWAQNELEQADVAGLREYLKALRFIRGYILTVERNSAISSEVLAGRAGPIGRDTFVKNVRVEGN